MKKLAWEFGTWEKNAARSHHPEYTVVRTYLEILSSLPWSSTTDDECLDIKQAREILEEDHYGLEKIKKRVLEFLAVRKLRKDMKGRFRLICCHRILVHSSQR